jgi:hypothetical protein
MEVVGHLHAPGVLLPRETAVVTDLIGRWMFVMEKGQISCPYRKLNPDPSIAHPVA